MEADEANDGELEANQVAISRTARRRGERGANLVEYCLLVVLIVLACIAGVSQFGKKVPADSFVSVSAAL